MGGRGGNAKKGFIASTIIRFKPLGFLNEYFGVPAGALKAWS